MRADDDPATMVAKVTTDQADRIIYLLEEISQNILSLLQSSEKSTKTLETMETSTHRPTELWDISQNVLYLLQSSEEGTKTLQRMEKELKTMENNIAFIADKALTL
jgi:hypothetical protein